MHHATSRPAQQASLLLVLPGLSEIGRAVERGANIDDHLPALTRIVTRAEREHHPEIDAFVVYADAAAWLRAREVRR